MSTNGEAVYHLAYSGEARAKLQAFVGAAPNDDTRRRILAAARIIDDRLRKAGPAFGEPLYYLKDARLLVGIGGAYPLFALFGVNEMRRLVIIQDLRLLDFP